MIAQARETPKFPGCSAPPAIAVSCACVDVEQCRYEHFAAMLSLQELLRAEQFHAAIDRRRYVVRHGMFREFLADQLACDPLDIPLVCEHFQKPYVDGGAVSVSMSHSHGLALYAFSRDTEIGCDIEFEDGNLATQGAAEMFLAASEIVALQSLSESDRVGAFFHYWTAKESYLKAQGTGLSEPMQTVVTSHGPLSRFMALGDDDPAEWSLIRLDLPKGYAGALAVRSPTAILCSYKRSMGKFSEERP